MARLKAEISAVVRDALQAAAQEGDPVNLVSGLSSKVPIQVLGTLMGVPAEMEAGFCRYAVQLQNAINPLSDAATQAQADDAADHFEAMISELIDRARISPGDDLLSALVHEDGKEGRLSHPDLLGITTAIIMAGAETTGSLVNHAVVALLAHPDQLHALRQQPQRMEGAVEELGRFEFPTKFVTRYALDRIELADRVIEPGELIFGALGAANRDPRVFPDPDRLDITRDPGPTLSFGAGAYFCLGASLARAEACEMISQLICNYPELQLADEPRFTPHFNIRRMSELPVWLGPRSR